MDTCGEYGEPNCLQIDFDARGRDMRKYKRNGEIVVRFSWRDVAIMLFAWGGFCLLIVHIFELELLDSLYRQARGTRFEKPIVEWAIRDHKNPIIRDLARRKFKAGDPAADLLAQHPPLRTEAYGPYTLLLYYPAALFGGPTVVVKDGRLVSAGTNSYGFSHVFFNTLTPTEQKRLSTQIAAQRQAESEARDAALMAVAGPAATIDPWTIPQPAPPAETENVHH
jgi:hypothetical protein